MIAGIKARGLEIARALTPEQTREVLVALAYLYPDTLGIVAQDLEREGIRSGSRHLQETGRRAGVLAAWGQDADGAA